VVNTVFHVAGDRVFILQAVRERDPKGLSGFRTRSLDLVTVDIRDPLAPRVYPRFNLLELKPELKPSYFMGSALAYRTAFCISTGTTIPRSPDRRVT
jgi:hypothetical protein